jgi:hypothetical protein
MVFDDDLEAAARVLAEGAERGGMDVSGPDASITNLAATSLMQGEFDTHAQYSEVPRSFFPVLNVDILSGVKAVGGGLLGGLGGIGSSLLVLGKRSL